jgi:hypothetical protein
METASPQTEKLTFAAFDRWGVAGDIMALSEFDRTLVLVWSFLGIAISEGLPDFFETSTAEFEQENIAALERIGARDAASVLRAAYRQSQRIAPDLSNLEALFGELSNRLASLEWPTWKLLDHYAQRGAG